VEAAGVEPATAFCIPLFSGVFKVGEQHLNNISPFLPQNEILNSALLLPLGNALQNLTLQQMVTQKVIKQPAATNNKT